MTGSMNRKPTLALIAGCLALTGALAASAGAQSTASPVGADADSAADLSGAAGEQLYMTVCAACHMPDAKGAQGAGFYPALAGHPRLRAGGSPARSSAYTGSSGMPQSGATPGLSDR